jgi:radical SAM protein with 4Fe4S-binding SPASM domain
MIINLDDYFLKGENWLYNQLSALKQDSLPDDFRITILYTSDQFDNMQSLGTAISKLQELLTLLDFPNFFVIIKTTNKEIKSVVENLKDLYCPHESVLSYELITGDFKKTNIVNDTICVLPWIHMYVNSQGKAGTCCEFDEKYPLGSIKDTPLSDIENNEEMRAVRRQMLSGQRPNSCSACWVKEDLNLPSSRLGHNQTFKKYLPLTKQTLEDGTFNDFKLKYLDFRASNVCNLKCRMCSGKFSSSIAAEEKELYDFNYYVELKLDATEISDTLSYVEKNINHLDQIYFAGGEPLIMKEHYQILDLLVKYKKTNIKINYNTNLTKLVYKKKNVIDYWKQFSNITVGASIDLLGPQAEYVRNGTNYNTLEENYIKIKDIVDFNITSIVHMLNIFNLPKLQKHWIVNKKLDPKNLTFRALVFPNNMSLQVLPIAFKDQAHQTINQHINWLTTVSSCEHLVKSWHDVLQYMYDKDQSHLLSDFFRLNDDKDRYRNEKFEEVFPEFNRLRDYIC